ncbi:MAG: ABC transporter ATP-binding protein [Fusobacteriaceae bacterium]
MIKVENISKKYGENIVVDNVSLEIPQGKITSIIGPNGAGKSTLLSIMSRLMKGDSGSIKINDKDIGDWEKRELSKTLAILKQENSTNLKLTVYELISFGRFPHNPGNLGTEDKKIIEKAIKYMDLENFKNRYLDELSGGQRQRAYIAMTIAQDTQYILLDEPLNNLDMKNSVHMMKSLRKMVDELQKTVILVMHDINFTSVYSDYIVAMKNGKVKYMDETKKVVQKEKLEKLYDMKIDVQEINDKNICIYF